MGFHGTEHGGARVGRPERARKSAVSQVRDSLRTDIAAIYRDMVPALHGLSVDHVYDVILGNPDILDGCFRLFHARREAFQGVLVDPTGQAVASDTAPLSCGRTVSDVIGMALRSTARRHFRKELGGPVRRPPPPAPRGVLAWVRRTFGTPPPRRATVTPGAGDRLYMAMRDYLLYDWQARLIPFYTPLPERVVRDLGERLLDYREPGDLQALAVRARGGAGMALGAPVARTGGERRLGGMREEEIWEIYQNAGLQRRLGIVGSQQGRRVVALAASVGEGVDRLLRTELRLNRLQMVAATCACADVFGPDRFLSLFCDPGEASACEAWRQGLVASAVSRVFTPDEVAQGARQAAMMAATAVAQAT